MSYWGLCQEKKKVLKTEFIAQLTPDTDLHIVTGTVVGSLEVEPVNKLESSVIPRR